MSVPRSVPWSDWDEWTYAQSCLFAGVGLEQQQQQQQQEQHVAPSLPYGPHAAHGLELIRLWRVRGRVPHSVESTAQLVEILLLDVDIGGVRRRSEMELRLQYSLAVIRAVNGLVDPSQQGVFADSVFSIAQSIGLPGWIVELRHDATHNQLPSLTVLRSAARQLVVWYRDNYWQLQSRHLEALSQICFANPASGGGGGGDALLVAVEASSTILSEIFMPLFLTSIFTQLGGSVAGTLRTQAAHDKNPIDAVRKLFNKQRGHWWQRISGIFKATATAAVAGAGQSFVDLLLCRLFSAAIASCRASALPVAVVEKRIALCELWVLEIAKSKAARAASTGSGFVGGSTALSRLVDSALANSKHAPRVAAALRGLRDHIAAFYSRRSGARGVAVPAATAAAATADEDEEEVEEEEEEGGDNEQGEREDEGVQEKEIGEDDGSGDDLEAFEALVGGCDNNTSTSTSTAALPAAPEPEPEPAKKRQRHDDVHLGWTKVKDATPWPLGLVPGRVENKLFLIR